MMTSTRIRKSILRAAMAMVLGVLAYEMTRGGLSISTAIIGIAQLVMGGFAYRKINAQSHG